MQYTEYNIECSILYIILEYSILFMIYRMQYTVYNIRIQYTVNCTNYIVLY